MNRKRSSRRDSNSRSKRDSRRDSKDSKEDRSRSRRDRDRDNSEERKSRDGSKNSDRNSKKSEEEEVPIEDVRKHILQHYGISAEEEKLKKERKAEKFRNYVQNSGLQLAFQLVISEMITKNVDKDQVFKYAVKRFREMGREYADIKKSVQEGEDRRAKSKTTKKKRR